MGKKKRFFQKGKIHTVQRQYLQRNGYDSKGYLVSQKNYKKKAPGAKSKKKKAKKALTEREQLDSVSKLTEDQASEQFEVEEKEGTFRKLIFKKGDLMIFQSFTCI